MIPRKEVEVFRDLFDKALKDTVPDGEYLFFSTNVGLT